MAHVNPTFHFVDAHAPLLSQLPQPVGSPAIVREYGPPPLARQLRGRFILRHKGRPLRRHHFGKPTDDVLLKTHHLKNVWPLSVGEQGISVSGDSTLEITFTCTFPEQPVCPQ